MSKIPKDSIKRLSMFQQEVSTLFKQIFKDIEEETTQKILDNVNFPLLVDVFETEKALIVEAEIPGIDKDNIILEVSEDSLIISGIKRENRKTQRKVYFYCMERDFGKFNRVIELPKASDTAQAEAKLSGGILTIIIPKIMERRGRPRKIDIQGEQQ